MPPPLAEHVALVTGAGRGIGRAIALGLASHGAAVGLVARTKAQLEAVAEEIHASGGRATAFAADLTDDVAVQQTVERARDQLGSIAILVNNAGWAPPRTRLVHTRMADIDRMLATNLRAPLLLTQLVLPDMEARRRGWILNVASAYAMSGHAGESIYAATKAGLLAFSRSLAAEYADRGICVAALCPGIVDTDLIPLNRHVDRSEFLQPADVADAALNVVLRGEPGGKVAIPILASAPQPTSERSQ